MRKTLSLAGALGALLLLLNLSAGLAQEEPQPRVVGAPPDAPPADAVVLFDGRDLSAWTGGDGGPAGWVVAAGAMTVQGGDLVTRREFGDFQLHLEFMTPASAEGLGQDRGNSGIYIHRNYEVQILDSYGDNTKTYANGTCASIYKLFPPLVNASREPGQWQTYEIFFRAARFDAAGNRTRKALITLVHNGVLVQDHRESVPTGARTGQPDVARGPILLQDHHHPVAFRNIWIRELEPQD